MGPMTELLSRPPRPRGPRRPPTATPRSPRSVTVVGIVAALRSAALGVLAVMVLVLVAWASTADSGADAADAVATALQAWLVGHHAGLAVPGGELALVPLGLTALPLALLHTATVRAGRAAGVHGRAGVVALTSSVTGTYAVVATLVALLARTDAVQAQPVSAFLGAAGVAALGAGTGAVRAAGAWPGVSRRLPALVRAALVPAAGALATLVAGGALLVGGSLAVHHHRATLLLDGLGAGFGGGLLVALLCLLYLPTAAVWGLALAVGPGFAVGAGTSVSVTGTDLGAVPAFPLLAALPQEPGPAWAPMALLVPLGAGALAAVLAGRGRAVVGDGWRPAVELCAVTGALVAAVVGVLSLLASGPAGPGRLAETGPTWWLVAPLGGLEVAAVMAVVLLVPHRQR
jgi:hypothetical protein